MEFTQGVRFDALGLTEEVQRALKKKNIEESTPVQAGCIPPMREWKDVIAKAPTGTGKTFAFGIPIIEHIEPGSEETEAVILAPTRELAMQITAELRDLCVYLPGVRIVCLYGIHFCLYMKGNPIIIKCCSSGLKSIFLRCMLRYL